jgi:outer membrane protein OmpA-like peptidoglycan-associated protein
MSGIMRNARVLTSAVALAACLAVTIAPSVALAAEPGHGGGGAHAGGGGGGAHRGPFQGGGYHGGGYVGYRGGYYHGGWGWGGVGWGGFYYGGYYPWGYYPGYAAAYAYPTGYYAPPPAPVAGTEALPAEPSAEVPSARRSFQVFFNFDKSDITPAAASVIRQAAEAVKSGQATRINVVGHTDTVGTGSYNQTLSDRRAAAVRAQLIADGVQASDIDSTGVGKSELLVPTGDGVREAQNRRVEIVLTGAGASASTASDTPTRVATANCRDFQTSIMIDGHAQPASGTACQQSDGSWKVVR